MVQLRLSHKKDFFGAHNNYDLMKSRLSLIVQVNVVLNRTVLVDSD